MFNDDVFQDGSDIDDTRIISTELNMAQFLNYILVTIISQIAM